MDRFAASFEKRFDQVEQRFDGMTALDGIAGELDDRKKEKTAATTLMTAHATQLINHGKCINIGESSSVSKTDIPESNNVCL